MQAKHDSYDVGVIVGRFQVPDLHNGHVDLIQTVCDNHDKVIIFLGLSPLMVTPENPLDFEARKQMILEVFPHVNVLYVEDLPSDEAWSKKLDNQIERLTTPRQSVVLYGSRDSFIGHYTGRHATQELVQETYYSGTAIRKDVSRKSVKARSSSWRARNSKRSIASSAVSHRLIRPPSRPTHDARSRKRPTSISPIPSMSDRSRSMTGGTAASPTARSRPCCSGPSTSQVALPLTMTSLRSSGSTSQRSRWTTLCLRTAR
jgi:nicotinamide mononucleotide adenylyltransferase